MIHDIGAIVEWVSRVMTLLPGDLILTGTPEGVGPIEDGDTVIVSASAIPGNETSIAAVIDNLTRQGAKVICAFDHAGNPGKAQRLIATQQRFEAEQLACPR